MQLNGHIIIWILVKPENRGDFRTQIPKEHAEPVNSVNFVPMGVNKAKGVKEFLNIQAFQGDDSYAFGDSAGNIDMIQYVKYGTAMGNSVQNYQKR